MAKEVKKTTVKKNTAKVVKPKAKDTGGKKLDHIFWTEEKKKKAIEIILNEISDNGKSIRSILTNADRKVLPNKSTFFEWVAKDEILADQYARATELRTDYLFDKMLDIAFNTEIGLEKKMNHLGLEVTEKDMLGHRRLKIDTIKWQISKLNPKKYGDKMAHTIDSKSEITIETAEEREKRIQELLVKMGK